jgi:uncharacterized protein (DUF433 family)
MPELDRRSRRLAHRTTELDSSGLYTVPLAARLLQETPATVQRWAFGYRRRGVDYAPAISTDIPEIDEARALTFLELVELMFIQGLLSSGLSWTKVREASRVAARLLRNERHPFAAKRWFADAAAVYLRLGQEHGEELLIEVAGDAQVAMAAVLRDYLHELDFDMKGIAERWFPMGRTAPVVLDPRRSFGSPITVDAGVPTETIARLAQAGDSVQSIAAWYEMAEAEVEAAIHFEEALTYAS